MKHPAAPLALLALVALALPAAAHFPIALPARVFAERGQPLRVTYSFGHPFEATRVAAPKLAGAWVYPPEGERQPLEVAEIQDQGARAWALELTPTQRGDHLLVFQSEPVRHGNETLADLVKVVQPVGGVERGWDRSLGLDLELVPLTRPYALPVGVHFRLQVQRRGQPVPGARVEVERLNPVAPSELPPEAFITRVEKANAQGELAATLDAPGWWVLACEAAAGEGQHQRALLWVYVGRP